MAIDEEVMVDATRAGNETRLVTESLSGIDSTVLDCQRAQIQEIEQLTQVQVTDSLGLRGRTVMVCGSPAAVNKAMPFLENTLLGSSSWQTGPPGLSQEVVDEPVCSEAVDVQLHVPTFEEASSVVTTRLSMSQQLREALTSLTPQSQSAMTALEQPKDEKAAAPVGEEEGDNSLDVATRRKTSRRNKSKSGAGQSTGYSPEDVGRSVEPLVQFAFPQPAAIEGVKSRKRPILLLEQVGFKHNGAKALTLKDITFSMSQASRVLITGAKGSGKSTLAKLLVGSYKPTHGNVCKAMGLHLALFSQETLKELDQHVHLTPAQYMCSERGVSKDIPISDVEADLQACGLNLSKASSIGELTKEERLQLALAVVLWQKPQILIFDEIYISGAAAKSFREAVQDFKGGILILSHNRHRDVFEAVATEKWSIRGGQLERRGPETHRTEGETATATSPEGDIAEEAPAHRGSSSTNNTLGSMRPLSKAEAATSIREVERRLREGVAKKTLTEGEIEKLFSQLEQLKMAIR